MRWLVLALVLLGVIGIAVAPARAGSGFAEVVATLVSYDRGTHMATYRAQAVYRITEDRAAPDPQPIVVACNLLGRSPWTFRLAPGDSLFTFTVVNTGASWLETPADGWRVACRCAVEPLAKDVAVFGMFVTPGGLAPHILVKQPGLLARTFGAHVKVPDEIRLRLGWTRGLLDGTACVFAGPMTIGG
jgi:hypothetical protein